jgi:outer membrane protein TolC
VYAVLTALLLIAPGCSTTRRLERMESRVRTYLDRVQDQQNPAGQPVEELDVDRYVPADDRGGTPVELSLKRSLELAAQHSREYQTMRETLYSSAISLWVAQHQFEWSPGGSLTGMLQRDMDASSTALSGDGSLGVSRRFTSGARFTGSLALDTIRYFTGNRDVDLASLASFTLTQPLLAGRGSEIAREPLTQAERNLVYALRTYVRRRKDLMIRVADRYYACLSTMDAVDVARRNHENLVESVQRSELMAKAGRVQEFQVDQARQDELRARLSVLTAEQRFEASRDSLKQLLGLPLTCQITVNPEDLRALVGVELPEPPIDYEEALDYALNHRLDYATVLDRVEDARRAVRIAEDDLRMRLDLVVGGNASSPRDSRLRAMQFEDGQYRAGLEADLPLDKTNETATYRRAVIALHQQERDQRQSYDDIVAGLKGHWRDLRTAAESFRIQQVSVTLAERRVESTELLFKAGRSNMRDLLDARDSLTQAQNSLTQAIVTHRMTWLRLIYDLELLPADPETLWSDALAVRQDGDPAAAATPPAVQPVDRDEQEGTPQE